MLPFIGVRREVDALGKLVELYFYFKLLYLAVRHFLYDRYHAGLVEKDKRDRLAVLAHPARPSDLCTYVMGSSVVS